MSEIAGLPVHPAAELFPLMDGDKFDELVADIKANGQIDPIELDVDGNLIDGRNRARACERLGLSPDRKVYTGDDVWQHVISRNLHRRHLTDSQRSMVAAKWATRRPGERSPQGQIGDITDLPPTQAVAAELLGVGESSVRKANQVIREGVDDLRELVEQGHAPVATAARVATTLAPEQQHEYVEQVKAGADPVRVAPPPSTKPKPLPADGVLAARDLASSGHTTSQIAIRLGYSRDGMREFLKRHGVAVPADAVVGKQRNLDSTRIVSATVDAVNGIGMLFDRIDYDALEPEEVNGWLPILNESIRSLTTLRNRLKEVASRD